MILYRLLKDVSNVKKNYLHFRDEVQSFGEILYLEFIQDKGEGGGSRINLVKIEIQDSILHKTCFYTNEAYDTWKPISYKDLFNYLTRARLEPEVRSWKGGPR